MKSVSTSIISFSSQYHSRMLNALQMKEQTQRGEMMCHSVVEMVFAPRILTPPSGLSPPHYSYAYAAFFWVNATNFQAHGINVQKTYSPSKGQSNK